MKINRRHFLKSAAVIGAISALPLKSQNVTEIQETPVTMPTKDENCLIMPPSLNEKSIIALTASGSPTNFKNTNPGRKMFKNMGCKVISGDTTQWKSDGKYRYLSDSDKVRSREFMDFVFDSEVTAIQAARGGYGAIRILDQIDFEVIKNNPKMYIGFSDFTAILLAIHRASGLVTYHGPCANTSKNAFSQKHLKEICFYDNFPQPHIVTASGMRTINQGKALGRLVGGNLTVLMSLMGTPYEVETTGKILFIEEVSEKAHKVDRYIKQLELAGKLENLAGVMIGNIKNLNTRRLYDPNRGYTIKEVLFQYFKQYDYPVVYGMPFGHVENNITLPIGTYAEFDTAKKQLILHNSI